MDRQTTTGLLHLLNGQYRMAVQAMQAELRAAPNDIQTRLELACAKAAAGDVNQATEILTEYEPNFLEAPALARFRTAQAYVAIHLGEVERASRALREAISADSMFALAQFSLGRQLLFRKRNASQARPHLLKAAELEPRSRGLRLGLVSLEAESGNYSDAMEVAKEILRDLGFEIRPLLAFIVSWILSPSIVSRLFLLGCVLLFIAPILGPVVLFMWLLLGISSLILLRRLSPRLALAPLLIAIGLIILYAIRSLLLGRVFP